LKISLILIHRAGQRISPFFKRKIGQGNDVFFDGIPADSAVLEVRDEFENTRVYSGQECNRHL
jgi:hypothetical protein